MALSLDLHTRRPDIRSETWRNGIYSMAELEWATRNGCLAGDSRLQRLNFELKTDPEATEPEVFYAKWVAPLRSRFKRKSANQGTPDNRQVSDACVRHNKTHNKIEEFDDLRRGKNTRSLGNYKRKSRETAGRSFWDR